MLITNIRSCDSPDSRECVRIAADLSCDDRPGRAETLWFDLPAGCRDELALSGDAWLAATLPLACRLGESLRIDAPVDPVLHESSRELMEWWHYWFPAMKVVPVQSAGVRAQETAAPARTAQFFSGGVDSFFTLLRHADPADPIQIDDLLIGWGFDIPLADGSAFDRVKKTLAAVATRVNKRLVPFSTNFRQLRLGEMPWGTIGHGSAMEAVAQLFQRSYRRVLIPSTDGYRETGPWGSHAMTDHLYSTTTMRVIHDGAAFSRFQKVALVATSAVALGTLRVCWRSPAESNCGACEKCLRTMLALELCGALDKASTFDQPTLDLGRVSRIHCPHMRQGSLQLYYLELLDEARRLGRGDIAAAIARALRRSRWREPVLLATQRLSQLPVTGRLVKPLDTRLRRSSII